MADAAAESVPPPPSLHEQMLSALASKDSAALKLLGLKTPLPPILAKVEWSAEAVASAVLALAKLPDNAVSDLVLHDFFGHAPFRAKAIELSPRLPGGLRRLPPEEQREAARAWAELALRLRTTRAWTELEPLREARWTREALPIEPLRNGLQELQRQWSHTDDGTWPAAEREAWFALMQRLATELNIPQVLPHLPRTKLVIKRFGII